MLLLANININIVLEISFFVILDANVKFAKKKYLEELYNH